jgi:hypothetical protein
MDPAQINVENKNVLEIGEIKSKSSNIVAILTLLLVLVFLSVSALGIGFLVGKFQSLPIGSSKKTATSSTKIKDQTNTNVFSDKEKGYSLNYPDAWTASKKSGALVGATISKDKNSVEFWLTVDQPFTFGAEQKEALVTTNNLSLKINGQTAKMTEYIYTAGNYFSIVKLSAFSTNPSVTFWLKAVSQEEYKVTKEIAQSFQFD